MRRSIVFLSSLFVAAGMLWARAAWAQDSWPDFPLDPTGSGDLHTIDRGPGFYVSLVKALAAWALFAVWVRTTDWVNRDCFHVRQNYAVWNSALFFPFVATFVLLWLIPSFAIGFTLMVLAYLGSSISYVFVRNAAVQPHQRVLTPDHIRHLFTGKEKATAQEKGAPVELIAQGAADERDDRANLLLARQSPAFVLVKDLIADVIDERGDAVMLDFSPEVVSVRYQVDGIWHNNEPQERETGDAVLEVLKTLAALDKAERQKRQAGTFGAKLLKAKFNCRLVSQGTKTGERAVLKLEPLERRFMTFEALGMREKPRNQLIEILGGDSGMVLFSSLPAGGLTTLIDVSLEETDRLLRSFVAVEDVAKQERYIENVEVTTFNRAGGETPVTVLPQLVRSYPDVIVLRDLSDGETVSFLCEQVEANRGVMAGIRGKDVCDSILRVLALKVPPDTLAPAMKAVVHCRLIRTLCNGCKVAYEPTPDLLKKLGLPKDRVQALYREPNQEEVEKVCPECGGIGYLGRTGLFEMLVLDDAFCDALVRQPKHDMLKKAARAAGMRSLQEEGILLVARGESSLPELMRILKQ